MDLGSVDQRLTSDSRLIQDHFEKRIYIKILFRWGNLGSPRVHTLTSPRDHTLTSPRLVIPSPHLDFLTHVFIPSPHLDFLSHVFIPSPHLDIHTLTSPRLFISFQHTLSSPRLYSSSTIFPIFPQLLKIV